MRKVILLVVVSFIATSFAFSETKTIQGEVLDTFCYVTRDSKGKEHAQCASSCIKAGVPVAVLTADGQMYFPLRADHKPANPLFEKLGGENVAVTDNVFEKNNVKFIVVTNVAKAR